ncbi:hypothetical protein [Thermoactinospora rubra]|uniref:hypothetical protein n=1 Tax=Thermoactinospora rubra TaxID=1088767 RepID=UPI000A10F37F|nr:hypothetical protein [Thermoactinospora rubra]
MTAWTDVHAAVPTLIEALASCDGATMECLAAYLAEVIAAGGDLLWQWPGGDLPASALALGESGRAAATPLEVAQACALGIAVLAYAPGGVTVAGQHWCTARHRGCRGNALFGDLDTDIAPGEGSVYTPIWLAFEVASRPLAAATWRPGPLQTDDTQAWRRRPDPKPVAWSLRARRRRRLAQAPLEAS